MGILVPSKIGLVLSTSAGPQALLESVMTAATVEPGFKDRKLKYRMAPGIGTGSISELEPALVAQQHNLSNRPDRAIEIDLGPIVLRAWVAELQGGAEARYICINDPKVGYAWAKALAERTGETLTSRGISDFRIEPIKARG